MRMSNNIKFLFRYSMLIDNGCIHNIPCSWYCVNNDKVKINVLGLIREFDLKHFVWFAYVGLNDDYRKYKF
jgi:hypothetical protein